MLDIIIACFNSPSYLNSLFNSINIFIKNKELINIIVIDDCSSYEESYKNLIKQYAKFFKIKYYKTNKNSGPGIARNLGLKYSKNNFITFIDDDDIIRDDILNYCIPNYDLIVTNYNYDDTDKQIATNYINSVQGIIFKKSFLKEYSLKFPAIQYGCEDSVFRVLCFTLSNKILKIKDKSFYKKLWRTDSTFSGFMAQGGQLNIENYSKLEFIIFDNLYFRELYKYIKKYPNILELSYFQQNFLKVLDNIIDWNIIFNPYIAYNFVLDYLVMLMYNINFYLDKNILNENLYYLDEKLKSIIFISFLSTRNQDNILITNFKNLNSNNYSILSNFSQIINKYFILNFNNFYDIKSINNLYCNYYYKNQFLNKKVIL